MTPITSILESVRCRSCGGQAIMGYSLETDKVTLLCSNCHYIFKTNFANQQKLNELIGFPSISFYMSDHSEEII